ncbi:hypothetical protein WJX84_010144 [Apatococcus fuscideae]|uniref:Uncharacterized protein n=1 Tax=Apatococcus fuscideae TaxID=2026836 RepID=A0AAW1TKN6_9CHLO
MFGASCLHRSVVGQKHRLRGHTLSLKGRSREREALEISLDQFFAEIAGDSAEQCRQQWSTCVAWMRTRTSLAHPLVAALKDSMLQQVHMDIQQQPGYAAVRAAAIALTEQLARTRAVDL